MPFLLPLAICLIIHFFMHRGHGGGNGKLTDKSGSAP
ncbi:MAG: DUF2933 domain-containing protein [Rhodobacterales bacterium]